MATYSRSLRSKLNLRVLTVCLKSSLHQYTLELHWRPLSSSSLLVYCGGFLIRNFTIQCMLIQELRVHVTRFAARLTHLTDCAIAVRRIMYTYTI